MSTAKSMAANYLNGKRANAGKPTTATSRFKSSTSNLASSSTTNNNNSRLKSTSMTNLVSSDSHSHHPGAGGGGSRISRPASRNALDSIHMGMNAKYAQVQSKVLLQNIRPQHKDSNNDLASTTSKSKIPANNRHTLTPTTASIYATSNAAAAIAARKANSSTPTAGGGGARMQQSDRSQLINKIKSLQEELDKQEQAREELKQELEREKVDKVEQLQQVKLELQEKVAEHERQNEDYHQKLLEAYELADQNRRAADNILNESRQRDEESRKRIDELEQQLAELKEFVAMKEEMAGKMGELREQIREERERYEEKTRSLSQMFENEKIRRVKPSLQSVGSVNKLTADELQGPHVELQSKPPGQLLNRSEHDMYGSKLSTRMQDTAKSAWKASRKFANSVITGGRGGLSACRQCTKKRSSGGSLASSGNVDHSLNTCATQHITNQPPQHHQQQPDSVLASGNQHLTSIVQVGEHVQAEIHHSHQPVVVVQPTTASSSSSHHPSQNNESDSNSHTQDGLIRVDQNNKLTIVTRFNDSDCHLSSSSSAASSHPSSQVNSAPASSSGCCSDRSRCESSSSGRGTASDAGSSGASQNGDSDGLEAPKSSMDQTTVTSPNGMNDILINGHHHHHLNNHNNYPQQQSPISPTASQAGDQKRQHKRKSSLFKANKVFGGSQVSLNKLRSFFAVASSKSSSANVKAEPDYHHHHQQQQQHQQQRQQHQPHQTNGFFAQVINQSLPTPSFDQCQVKANGADVDDHKDYMNSSSNHTTSVAIDKYDGRPSEDHPNEQMVDKIGVEAKPKQVGQGEVAAVRESKSAAPDDDHHDKQMEQKHQPDASDKQQVPSSIQIQLKPSPQIALES